MKTVFVDKYGNQTVYEEPDVEEEEELPTAEERLKALEAAMLELLEEKFNG